jgi:hypothetical protein
VKEFATSIQNGVMPPMKDLHAQMRLDPELAQWMNLRTKVEGFSSTLKKNQDLVRTIPQIFKNLTGTDQGMMVFSQLFGDPESAQKTMDDYKKILEAKPEGDDVSGTGAINKTYKQNLDDAKAAWNSLTIEIGNNFLPTATKIMQALTKIGELLSGHPAVLKLIIGGLEALAARWLVLKAAMVIDPIVRNLATNFGKIWTSAQEAFGKIGLNCKKTYAEITDEAIASAGRSIQTAEGAANRQIESQQKVAAASKEAATEQTAISQETADKQIADQVRVTGAAEKTNAAIGTQRAEAGRIATADVEEAATQEIAAEERVQAAAEGADGAIAAGGAAGGKGLLARASNLILPAMIAQQVYDFGKDTYDNATNAEADPNAQKSRRQSADQYGDDGHPWRDKRPDFCGGS